MKDKFGRVFSTVFCYIIHNTIVLQQKYDSRSAAVSRPLSELNQIINYIPTTSSLIAARVTFRELNFKSYFISRSCRRSVSFLFNIHLKQRKNVAK